MPSEYPIDTRDLKLSHRRYYNHVRQRTTHPTNTIKPLRFRTLGEVLRPLPREGTRIVSIQVARIQYVKTCKVVEGIHALLVLIVICEVS